MNGYDHLMHVILQLGMADIEADLYGDVDNDEDLEAELLALEGKKPAPKRKPKGNIHIFF